MIAKTKHLILVGIVMHQHGMMMIVVVTVMKSENKWLLCYVVLAAFVGFAFGDTLGASSRGQVVADRACLKYEPTATHKQYLICVKSIGEN